MDKENKIKVLNENGEEVTAEILLYFSLDNTDKNYVLYTFGEIDSQKMETIYASILTKKDDGYIFESIPDEKWDAVKEVMREIIRNEGE